MTRSASHLVPVPAPAPVEPIRDAGRLLSIAQLADRLGCSRSKLERDIPRGLPHIDIAAHDPRRRIKRSLRFDWQSVIAWYSKGRP